MKHVSDVLPPKYDAIQIKSNCAILNAVWSSGGSSKMWFKVWLLETFVTKRNTFCRNRSLSNATFSSLITWRSPSSKSAAVYKISWKADFSQRYGDISIFKMAAVRHIGIVLPPYETTLEVFVAGHSCLSNFMSIWYTDLKIKLFEFFCIFSLKCLFRPPKWGFWGTLDP